MRTLNGAWLALAACVSYSGGRPLTGREVLITDATGQIPDPKIVHFTQKIDHYNYADNRTFAQRYFVYDSHFRKGGPLFFYTGNEGALESFYYNTGLPFDWAEEFGALIVFGEHRYYGQTLPFGPASFDRENLGYLSVSQVLADYAMLVTHLKASWQVAGVVAFGGSYGGMLSAWARIRFPNVFDMALAASAPIPQGINEVADKSTFYRLVTEDARKADPNCPDAVRAAFASVIKHANTDAGLQKISEVFNLCKVMTASELGHFLQYARNAWTEMAMCNYPYPSSFLAPLPAWPIKAACGKVLGASDPMAGLADAVAMLYKTPNATCFDMYTMFVECADQTGCGVGRDARAWDYQMCTEIFYEQATTNITDMFPPRNWTIDKLNSYCQAHYGVQPDQTFNRLQFGGADVARSASKIIFSNGLLDPWNGGGYLESQGPTLPAVVIELGAHHLDLRSAHKDDPPCVVKARELEKGYIKQWLVEGQGLCLAAAAGPNPGTPAIVYVLVSVMSFTIAVAVVWSLCLRHRRWVRDLCPNMRVEP